MYMNMVKDVYKQFPKPPQSAVSRFNGNQLLSFQKSGQTLGTPSPVHWHHLRHPPGIRVPVRLLKAEERSEESGGKLSHLTRRRKGRFQVRWDGIGWNEIKNTRSNELTENPVGIQNMCIRAEMRLVSGWNMNWIDNPSQISTFFKANPEHTPILSFAKSNQAKGVITPAQGYRLPWRWSTVWEAHVYNLVPSISTFSGNGGGQENGHLQGVLGHVWKPPKVLHVTEVSTDKKSKSNTLIWPSPVFHSPFFANMLSTTKS